MSARLFSVLAVLLLAPLFAAQPVSESFVVRDVRVFDGATIAEHQSVVVADGRIAAVGPSDSVRVPPGVREVSGAGRTLLPGLIDAHVHVPAFPAGALQQSLNFGVTTVLTMWSSPPLVARLKELETVERPDLASVRTAGTGATAPGGHPTQMEPSVAHLIPTLAGPSQADAFVAARIAEGSDFIKIIYDDANDAYGLNLPTLSEESIAAVVAAAHARGRLAIAHIGNERHARGAITAGVDGLAHLFLGGSMSNDFGKFAASHRVFVVPTLSVLYSVCGRPDGPEILADPLAQPRLLPAFNALLGSPPRPASPLCDAARGAIRQLIDAGVPVLAGTDAPAPGVAYGASLHRELEHLVNAGMTPAAALAAATSVTARVFGLTDRGRIAAGLRADLLLVDGDPSTSIRATRNIVAVWKRGSAVP